MRWYDRLLILAATLILAAGAAIGAGESKLRDYLLFYDNFGVKFGDAGDVDIRWDGTDLDILAAADNSVVKWGAAGNSFDHWFYGSDGNSYISFDASANDLKLEDSVSLMFGTGAGAGPGTAGDVEIRWDGTDLDILPAADDSVIKVGTGTLSCDFWLYGNATTTAVSWDASADDLKLEDSSSLMFGTGASVGTGAAGDVEVRWDGTDLDVLAAADDSVIKFGNGTNSFDVWTYGNTSSDYIEWDASAGELDFAGSAYVRTRTIVTAKTANYTVVAADYGTIFTNRGASAGVQFTLPAPAAGNSGDWVEFFAVAAQNVTVTTAAGEQLVTFNNATADSVSFQTSSEIIGAGLRARSDGTSWIIVPLSEETQTLTVTDN